MLSRQGEAGEATAGGERAWGSSNSVTTGCRDLLAAWHPARHHAWPSPRGRSQGWGAACSTQGDAGWRVVGLKAGGGVGSPDLREGGRRTHCVIPGEYSRGDRLMHSLPASPGADSLAADSSRLGASIPQDTFLAFGLGAHPRLPSALTPRPKALPTPRSCRRASTLTSLPPPPPPALEGLRAASSALPCSQQEPGW